MNGYIILSNKISGLANLSVIASAFELRKTLELIHLIQRGKM